MGELEPVQPDRRAGDIGDRVWQGETGKDGGNREERGEAWDQEADVCRGARCPEDVGGVGSGSPRARARSRASTAGSEVG